MQSEKKSHLAWFKNVEISIRADIAEKCLCNAVLSVHIPYSMTKLWSFEDGRYKITSLRKRAKIRQHKSIVYVFVVEIVGFRVPDLPRDSRDT